jgi:hypothetical protein
MAREHYSSGSTCPQPCRREAASRGVLNPIERFWQLLKQLLKNQIFPSLQALRERVQDLFDQLTLEQVASVAAYDFILEALFHAASH